MRAPIATASLSRASFAIASNGFADGPAEALRDYLVERGARVTTIRHPLTVEQGMRHVITEYENGARGHAYSIRVPARPPLSFAVDPFVPLRVPRADVWFGFNPLACARGLVQRRLRRAKRVVMWCVDFAPDRFGPGSPLTWLYDGLDRRCCLSADRRVELSEGALLARSARHSLGDRGAPGHIVPMGAWLDRVPTTALDGCRRRRVVYLGHLVTRQGVSTLLDALAILQRRNADVTADIIGTGPLERELRGHARRLALEDTVDFHGFVREHREVERILAEGSIGVAPYEASGASFTRHADPGKLKAYLAAGLPIVLTDVPPNASQLAEHAGAEIVSADAPAIARAIERCLGAPNEWGRRRNAALAFAQQFAWPTLLDPLLADLGWQH